MIASDRQKWLHRAGIIVGLAGGVGLMVVVFATATCANIEPPINPLSREVALWALIVGLPILVMVAIAWKWPLIGGILLIAQGLFWPIYRPLTFLHLLSTQPTADFWSAVAYYMSLAGWTILTMSLIPWAAGILFVLSWREEGKQQKEGRGFEPPTP